MISMHAAYLCVLHHAVWCMLNGVVLQVDNTFRKRKDSLDYMKLPKQYAKLAASLNQPDMDYQQPFISAKGKERELITLDVMYELIGRMAGNMSKHVPDLAGSDQPLKWLHPSVILNHAECDDRSSWKIQSWMIKEKNTASAVAE